MGHAQAPGPITYPPGGPLLYQALVGHVYEYDVLNRLLESDFQVSTGGTPAWGQVNGDDDEVFSYDANGNILTLERRAFAQGTNVMDNLQYYYRYEAGSGDSTNGLRYVTDLGSAGSMQFPGDIDDQSSFRLWCAKTRST